MENLGNSKKLRGIFLASSALVVTGILTSGAAYAADASGTPRYAVEDRIAKLEEELKALKSSYVKRGKKQVELEVSGQVNRGVLYFDDGEQSDEAFVDNDHSSTRVRWTGKAKINEFWSAGSQIEVQFESNSTASVSQANGLSAGPDNFTERKLEFWVERKLSDNAKARLWVGQGDTASNGTSEVDNSGTDVILYSGIADTAGGILFRAPGGALTGTNIGNVFNQLDGLSRQDRVRLDVSVGPVMVSGSTVQGERYDVAGRFNHTFNDQFKVSGAIAYAEDHEGTKFDQVNGSLSIRHIPTGISLTGAAGQQDFDAGRTRDFYYAKAAIERDLFEVGSTAVGADFFHTEDAVANGDEGQAFGVAMVQNIDAAAMEIYLGYRHYEYEDSAGVDYQDIDAVLGGARLKF